MTDSVNHPESVRNRFWQYTHRKQDHQCWPWLGSLTVRGGYGQLNDRGRLLKTHRLSWELHLGAIPPHLLVRHMCHNPACCNPSHLLLGTTKDNHLDMQRAKRMVVPTAAKGEDTHCAKLTEKEVRSIRLSSLPGVDLARRYGVSKAAISNIRLRKTWKHLK
jgi:hypothetical protein